MSFPRFATWPFVYALSAASPSVIAVCALVVVICWGGRHATAQELLGPSGPSLPELPAPGVQAAPERLPVPEIVFPALPPNPYEEILTPLPPLDCELWNHGGSYLYHPEGDGLGWPGPDSPDHFQVLRLSEDWVEPQPWTLYSEFLGADPVTSGLWSKWPGWLGYYWDPRFVGYGEFSTFGLALSDNGRRQDGVGGQLRLDLDLRLTGTERFHLQFRPLGDGNSGGSFYRFNRPAGYLDNSTAEPQRYWFECELRSLLGGHASQFLPLDQTLTVGKFPFTLQNSLLINDEILGLAFAKNNLYLGRTSNLNLQYFYAFNDIQAEPGTDGQMYGANAFVDRRHSFYELSYVYLAQPIADRKAHYAAAARTQFCGPLSWTLRGLMKFGDAGGRGSGQLYVAESNYTCEFDGNLFQLERAVYYCNLFWATEGWNPISGGNFNRLTSAFETNPLVRISAGLAPDDNWGIASGVHIFRHFEDESIIPEVALENPQGRRVWAAGLRYLRKLGPRSYFECLLSYARSADDQFDREGVLATYHLLF